MVRRVQLRGWEEVGTFDSQLILQSLDVLCDIGVDFRGREGLESSCISHRHNHRQKRRREGERELLPMRLRMQRNLMPPFHHLSIHSGEIRLGILDPHPHDKKRRQDPLLLQNLHDPTRQRRLPVVDAERERVGHRAAQIEGPAGEFRRYFEGCREGGLEDEVNAVEGYWVRGVEAAEADGDDAVEVDVEMGEGDVDVIRAVAGAGAGLVACCFHGIPCFWVGVERRVAGEVVLGEGDAEC